MHSTALAPSGAAVITEFVRAPSIQPAESGSAHADTVSPFCCAAGHGPAPTIAIVCADEACENHLVVWPKWFSKTVNRQLFVNGLRSAALCAALALGYLGLTWPVGLAAALLIFLLLSVLLREHLWAERRTLVGATAMLATQWALRLPAFSAYIPTIVTYVVPIGITSVFVLVAWPRHRSGLSTSGQEGQPHRLAYVPFFAAAMGAVVGLGFLDAIAHVYSLTLVTMDLTPVVDAGLKSCVSVFAGSIIVGGVLAGLAKELPRLNSARVRGPRLKTWTPPRIPRRRSTANAPALLRSFMRTLDTLAYVLAVAFRSVMVQTCNAFVNAINRLLSRAFAILNAAVILARRFARRLAAIVSETILLIRDGCASARRTSAIFARFYLLPFVALAILGRGVIGVQEGIGAYVGAGNPGGLIGFAVSAALIVLAVSALAALQTFTNMLVALQIVLRGLVEPAVGALLFFILMSVGLALSSNVIGRNPYSIGPVTICSGLLVVIGFGLQLVLARRSGAGLAPTSIPAAAPRGTPVRIAPAARCAAVLGVLLISLTVASGGTFV